jgi:hypothetical protein
MDEMMLHIPTSFTLCNVCFKTLPVALRHVLNGMQVTHSSNNAAAGKSRESPYASILNNGDDIAASVQMDDETDGCEMMLNIPTSFTKNENTMGTKKFPQISQNHLPPPPKRK